MLFPAFAVRELSPLSPGAFDANSTHKQGPLTGPLAAFAVSIRNARFPSILLKNPVVAPALGILGRCRLGGLLPLGLMWRRSAPDEG